MGTALLWLLVGFVAGAASHLLWTKYRAQIRWYTVVLALVAFLGLCLTVAFLVTSLAEREPRAALLGTVIMGLISLVLGVLSVRLRPKAKKA